MSNGMGYLDITDADGRLVAGEDEITRQLYGMIWYLAQGNPALVEDARQRWKVGMSMSPGESDA